MAGYEDTRQKIISTLMGRPNGTEIQPENHQDYALNMLDYIRSLELIATSTLIGIAESNTTPVQPNDSRVCYIAGVAQNQTVTFENFIAQNGNPISITTGDMEGVFVILMWNTQYWSAQTFSTNIISHSESATFYYRYNIRKTYASIALMNADVASPIGTDGKYIKVGDIVTVVNSTTPSENGFYSYEGAKNGWKLQSGFNFQVEQSRSQNVNSAPSSKLFDDKINELAVDIVQLETDLNVLNIQQTTDNILSGVTWLLGRVFSSGTINTDYGTTYSYVDINILKGNAIHYSLIVDSSTGMIGRIDNGVYTLISKGIGSFKSGDYVFGEDSILRICIFTTYISTSAISVKSSGVISDMLNKISAQNVDINNAKEDVSNLEKSFDFGKKSSVEGLSGADTSIVSLANSFLKSVELLSEPAGYTAGSIRLKQIYCLTKTVSSARWVIQISYTSGGNIILLQSCNIDMFSQPSGDFLVFENIYIKTTWDAQALWNYAATSATTYLIDSTVNNPYKVHLVSEDKYFDGKNILEKSITENKLANEIVAKLNNSMSDNGFLTNKKLVTLCDSLGTAGIWQTKLSELSGAIFDNEKNYQHYSYGGTRTLSGDNNDGQSRAKLLVDEGLIVPDVIIIQNVNDSLGTAFQNIGTTTDESYFCKNKINVVASGLTSTNAAKNYWTNNFATIVGGVTIEIGAMLKVPFTSTKYTLKITSIPSAAGSFIITLGGSDVKIIPIEINDTIENIVDKINIIAFPNYSHYKSGTDSVVFTYQGANAPSIDINAGSTGVASTIATSMSEITRNYCFVSHDISNWTNPSKWLCSNSPSQNENITLMSVYKGLIEYLQSNFPNAFIYWFFPKCYSFDYILATYKRADGTIDYDKVLSQATYGNWIFSSQKTFCDYYNIPYLDIRSECCITPANIATYFNPNDVHPKTAGYKKWGEALFRLLG